MLFKSLRYKHSKDVMKRAIFQRALRIAKIAYRRYDEQLRARWRREAAEEKAERRLKIMHGIDPDADHGESYDSWGDCTH